MRYSVTVKGFGRISVQTVEAASQREAEELAMNKAGISVKSAEQSTAQADALRAYR